MTQPLLTTITILLAFIRVFKGKAPLEATWTLIILNDVIHWTLMISI